jgi:aerobic carbon-monoxide dehydrogenase small subunit
MAKKLLTCKVNGKTVEKAVEPRTLLIHFLREELNLTGAHIGCETSHCGACTVDIDGRSVKSCTHLAVQCEGSRGADRRRRWPPWRRAARGAGGLLQGARPAVRLLHPGMLMRAYRFLQENPNPSEPRSAPA